MDPETRALIGTLLQIVVVPLLGWLIATIRRFDKTTTDLERSVREIHQWAFGLNDSPGAVRQLKHLESSTYANSNNVHALAGAIEITRLQAKLEPLELKLSRGASER